MTTDTAQLDELILQRLPILMRQNKEVQELVMELARQNFADRKETEDRFYQLLNELRRDREEQSRKWEENNKQLQAIQAEQNRKWEENNKQLQAMQAEQNRKWEENNKQLQAMQAEQSRKWEENNKQLQAMQAEQNRKWEEQNRKWEEQNRKWEDAKHEFEQMHKAIMAIAQKQERSIGALGARWGSQTESAFRKALAGILEASFGVEVLNINDYDDKGDVFGRPDQVEIDVIIKNGLLIACEIKSSIDKADMYIFERKVRFYEKKHERKANRMLVISPMVAPRAYPVASKLGIEVYSDSIDVTSLD